MFFLSLIPEHLVRFRSDLGQIYHFLNTPQHSFQLIKTQQQKLSWGKSTANLARSNQVCPRWQHFYFSQLLQFLFLGGSILHCFKKTRPYKIESKDVKLRGNTKVL